MSESNIPKVELYVSDKAWLGVFLVVQASFFVSAAKLPEDARETVVYVALLIGSVGTPLLMRLVPTSRQAGALRIASGVMRRLKQAEDVAEGVVSAVPSRLETKQLEAIVKEAVTPPDKEGPK